MWDIWVMWPAFLGCSWSGGTLVQMHQWDSLGMWIWDSRMQLVSGCGWTRGTCKLGLCGADIFFHVHGATEKADLSRRQSRHTETARDVSPLGRKGPSCLSSLSAPGFDSSPLWDAPPSCYSVRCFWILIPHLPFLIYVRFCFFSLPPFLLSSFLSLPSLCSFVRSFLPSFFLSLSEFISIIYNSHNPKKLKRLAGQIKAFRLFSSSSGDSAQAVNQ